jgi:hypothetical protein
MVLLADGNWRPKDFDPTLNTFVSGVMTLRLLTVVRENNDDKEYSHGELEGTDGKRVHKEKDNVS